MLVTCGLVVASGIGSLAALILSYLYLRLTSLG